MKNRDIGIVVGAVVLVVLLAAGFWYYTGSSIFGDSETPVACTQEAKLCPDGSYVGRTGPLCEFAPCPTTSTTPQVPNIAPSGPDYFKG